VVPIWSLTFQSSRSTWTLSQDASLAIQADDFSNLQTL
jgi:hypothetical protein